MAHLSENAKKLEYIFLGETLPIDCLSESDVWFVSLPYYKYTNLMDVSVVTNELNAFIETTSKNASIVLLTSPFFAATFLASLTPHAKFRNWIGVKLSPLDNCENQLLQNHAALLFLTRYTSSLKHNKTRIAYSFCPSCDRTTKDYGGKKHLYNEYGTMMSDVWRDIELHYNSELDVIIDRISDLFGFEPYLHLKHIDLRQYEINKKWHVKTYKVFDATLNNLHHDESILINGDCLEELKTIPDNSVDFCFADPPYNIKKKYESWNDGIDIRKYFLWCDNWITELARIIKPGRTVALLNIPQWAVRHFKHLITLLDYQDWIIWEALGLPVRLIMPSHYTILCFSKGEPRELPGLIQENNNIKDKKALTTNKEWYCSRPSCIKNRNATGDIDKQQITNLWWDIHRLKHNSNRVDHPTQLPPVFMQRLISLFTYENEVVLDPFNGAGTTSLCAHQLNRKYIGIELSSYYHNIADKRHIDLLNGDDPFRKNGQVPKAKNSYVERLKKQKYVIDKKTLQLEVKEIAKKLNKIPTREDVLAYSKYDISFFDNYFISWSEVTAAARTTGMEQVEEKANYDKLNPA